MGSIERRPGVHSTALLGPTVSPPLNQRVTTLSATCLGQAAQNLRVSAAVTICLNTGSCHDLNHAVKLVWSLWLPSDNTMLGE